MALNYGFFDSAEGDNRTYIAADFAKRFSLFFTNGVREGELLVTAGLGKDVNVAAGYANINGYHVQNDAVLNLAIGANTSGLPRIDRIIIKLDLTTRAFAIYVKAGTPASSPVPPTLTRNISIYELSIAQVRINNNASAVNVTDERSSTSVCGYIKVDTFVPVNELWLQFNQELSEIQAAWDEWFTGQYAKITP
ncbi:MAG: hypothetical protein AAGU14_00175, partial [Eubacteriaceae bacterium]